MLQESVKTVAELLAQRSVDSLIEGAAVFLFASLILRIVPRQNAASRFGVWFCALLAIAGIPVLSAAWFPAGGFLSGGAERTAIRVPDFYAVYFLGFWATVSFCLLLQIVRSLWRLRSLRQSCSPVNLNALDPQLQQTLLKHGTRRKVTICTSQQVRVPAALGLWRPAVVLPEWTIKELSPDELNHIVLHELAHLERWDDWTNLAQQILRAMLFFHPAVWWIEKRAALEREIACDDVVLAETSRPRAYAECLARLAEKSFAHRGLAMAQAVLGKARQMSTRVARILDVNRPASNSIMWRPAVSLVAAFAIGMGIWIARTPRLVTFVDHSPSPSAPIVTNTTVAALKEVESRTASAPVQLADRKLAALTETRSHVGGIRQRPMTVPAKPADLGMKDMIHVAKAKSSPPPITETMWLVVENNGSTANGPVLQIQMWRVMILHVPVADATPRIPRKI